MNKPKSEGGPAQGDAAKQPWDVVIDVYLRKGCPDPDFELKTCLPVSNDRIVFKNNRRPGFNIYFNLHDETGEGYFFPPQSKVEEACWSQVGTTCPTSPIWEVLEPRHVSNNQTTLEVYNENPNPPLGDFEYALRVTKDGGANYCKLDPGGTDTNGARQ